MCNRRANITSAAVKIGAARRTLEETSLAAAEALTKIRTKGSHAISPVEAARYVLELGAANVVVPTPTTATATATSTRVRGLHHPDVVKDGQSRWRCGNLTFAADFEAANLRHVQLAAHRPSLQDLDRPPGPKHFNLELRPDPGCQPKRGDTGCWFYFSVSGAAPGETISFTITNLMNQETLYNEFDHRIAVCDTADPSAAGGGWRRHADRAVVYTTPGWTTLGWSWTWGAARSPEQHPVYFAFCTPYTVTDWVTYVDSVLTPAAAAAGSSIYLLRANPFVARGKAHVTTHAQQTNEAVEVLTISSATTDVPRGERAHDQHGAEDVTDGVTDGVTIASTSAAGTAAAGRGATDAADTTPWAADDTPMAAEDTPLAAEDTVAAAAAVGPHEKQTVLISCRVHPGETPSSYMLEGFLNYLCSAAPEAAALRNRFVFKVMPVLNPEGVCAGNYRTDNGGYDLNRCYRSPSDAHPSILQKLALATNLAATGGSLFFHLDLHAHPNLDGLFLLSEGVFSPALATTPAETVRAGFERFAVELAIRSIHYSKVNTTLGLAQWSAEQEIAGDGRQHPGMGGGACPSEDGCPLLRS
jgi:hypothetical protein